MTSIEELNPELQGIGRYQFGWADRDDRQDHGDQDPGQRRPPATRGGVRCTRGQCRG